MSTVDPGSAVFDPAVAVPARQGRAGFTGMVGGAVAITGMLVLVGWAMDVEALKSIVPGLIVMIPNTATGFVLAGAALWLLRAEPVPPRTLLAAQLSAVVVLALGSLTFVERTLGFDFGIDLLLFADQVRSYPYLPPGRMATNSTVCFILAGTGLLLLGREPVRGPGPREVTAATGLAITRSHCSATHLALFHSTASIDTPAWRCSRRSRSPLCTRHCSSHDPRAVA